MTGRIIFAFWLGASLSIMACTDNVGPDEAAGVNDLKVISPRNRWPVSCG